MDSHNHRSYEVAASRSSFLLLLLGWISAIVSLFAFPLIFGVLGVVLGIIAAKNGSRSGVVLIAGSIIIMAIGLLFSGVIMNYTLHYLNM